MTPVIQITESASPLNPPKARALLRRGWRRAFVTVLDSDTGEPVVSYLAYLPPATNIAALERMLALWAI